MNNRILHAAVTLRAFVMALPFLLPGAGAFAQGSQDSGWYVGASAGWSWADIERSRIVSTLQSAGYTTSRFDADDSDNAYKIFGGYDFNRHIGLEAGYFDLGRFDYNADLMPSAMQGGHAAIDGFAIDLVATLPLQSSLSAFARAGISNARVEQDFTSASPGTGFTNRSDRGANEKYGAGLQYVLNDTLAIRAEVERYRIDNNRVIDDKVDTFMVGIVYRFGARGTSRPVAQPAQQVPVRTQAPPPVTAPAPQPAPPVAITLSASTLFDFDRAVLRPEGRNALDGLVRDMEGLNYDVVIVTGHTDRIGTRDYNLGLSLRRANTVRTYLVAAGVPEQRITARGVNSDEPVTTQGQCTGPVSDALKACLQPDRRVVVEVSGMRDAP